jgi:uncharacterized membrane protein YdbT with pleckstrin-like domain
VSDPAAEEADSPGHKLTAKPNAPADADVEQELWQGTFSPKAALPMAVIAAILSVALIVVAVMFGFSATGWLIAVGVILLTFACLGLQLWLTRLSTAYRLTTQRLVHEVGLFSRVTNRVEVIDIDDVTIEQGLIDRMLGIGTIKLSSSDRTHPVLPLRGVDDVRVVADQIDQARRTERIRRGLHIEAV